MKTYSELIKIPSYHDRFAYLKLGGKCYDQTFGRERWLNQVLYQSPEWRKFRRSIILRDSFGGDYCLDMAASGYEIRDKVLIHHLNPLTVEDVLERNPKIFDPENVVTVSFRTHNAIHYGDDSLLPQDPLKRFPGDTCPWRV